MLYDLVNIASQSLHAVRRIVHSHRRTWAQGRFFVHRIVCQTDPELKSTRKWYLPPPARHIERPGVVFVFFEAEWPVCFCDSLSTLHHESPSHPHQHHNDKTRQTLDITCREESSAQATACDACYTKMKEKTEGCSLNRQDAASTEPMTSLVTVCAIRRTSSVLAEVDVTTAVWSTLSGPESGGSIGQTFDS